MKTSLIGKFAFVFWLLYFAVIAPIFVFIQYSVSSIFDENEKNKVELVIQTLMPVISTYLTFDQHEMLSDTMRTFFQNPNIVHVVLYNKNGKIIFEQKYPTAGSEESVTLSHPVNDSITHEPIAELKIGYSNEYVKNLQLKLFGQLILLSFLALIVFFVTYHYFQKQFGILRNLSRWMGNFTVNKTMKPFNIDNANIEINTITASANKMVDTIENYRHQMELIQNELEHRVENEIKRRRQKEQLLIHQSRLAAMGEMIENIAHQWRQPLNIIGLATANLEMKNSLAVLNDDELNKNIGIINQNITFMSDTIDDFRKFFSSDKELVLIHPLNPIHEIFDLLGEQLRHANIAYTIHSECDRTIYGVVNEFKQVILNIVNNAKDVMSAKKEYAQANAIEVWLRCDESRFLIDISDTGGGVPQSIIERIFDPYFTTKFQKQGTGIGLYMSKVIIEQHFEGSLSVKNNAKGAVFTIAIPLVDQ